MGLGLEFLFTPVVIFDSFLQLPLPDILTMVTPVQLSYKSQPRSDGHKHDVLSQRGEGGDSTVSQITFSCYFSLIALLVAGSECIKLSLRRQDLNLGGKKKSISRGKLELKERESSEKNILLVIRHSESGPPPPDDADVSPFPYPVVQRSPSMGCQ